METNAIVTTLTGASPMPSEVTAKIADFANVIQAMTREVFSTMLGLDLATGTVEQGNESVLPHAGIVAMVGIAGAVSGNVIIRISDRLSCSLASRFLVMEYPEVNEEVLDAIAELANMIVGGLKTHLEDQFGPMGLSLPTVISSERYITRSPALGDRFTISFDCDQNGASESFTIQICLITEKSNNSYLRELAELHSRLV